MKIVVNTYVIRKRHVWIYYTCRIIVTLFLQKRIAISYPTNTCSRTIGGLTDKPLHRSVTVWTLSIRVNLFWWCVIPDHLTAVYDLKKIYILLSLCTQSDFPRPDADHRPMSAYVIRTTNDENHNNIIYLGSTVIWSIQIFCVRE